VLAGPPTTSTPNGFAPSYVAGAQAFATGTILDNETVPPPSGPPMTTLTSQGTINFSDVDTNDTHSASFVAQAAGYRGIFALDPVNQTADSVGWTFSVAASALDDLVAGQELTQRYDVTIGDGHGGTALQTVTITLNGINDGLLL
jgi:VCBS repeat-containing protein